MVEILTMSTKERQRLQVISRIHHRDTTVAAVFCDMPLRIHAVPFLD